MLSVKEVANKMNVQPQTVRKYISVGFKRDGRRIKLKAKKIFKGFQQTWIITNNDFQIFKEKIISK